MKPPAVSGCPIGISVIWKLWGCFEMFDPFCFLTNIVMMLGTRISLLFLLLQTIAAQVAQDEDEIVEDIVQEPVLGESYVFLICTNSFPNI